MKQCIPALAAFVLGTALAQTQSVEQANATLAKVEQERARVEAEFADSERDCYERFFVNACLDKAKEKRHGELARLRAQEVEANHFKREDAVKKRDAELAERARKDAEDEAARAAAEPKPAKTVNDTPGRAPSNGPTVAEREAQHEAKVKRQQAEEAANAGKRAANRAAFEKKAEESKRRQAEVARKKEEAEQKRQAQEEAERKKAASAAASAAASVKP